MYRRLLAPALLIAVAAAAAAREPAETVVLLHGLGRTERSMRPMARALEEAGYAVHNLGYPSTALEPEDLVSHVGDEIQRCCEGAPRLHFVTHSLGGVLVRGVLAQRRPARLGRVVMLAPPNSGSELVDWLGDSALFAAIFGPTATELGTGDDSLPNRLPAPDYEVGVIAGVDSLNPVGERVVPGPDDGTVSVESTRIEGMTDHVEVEASHTFIMRSPEVAALVVRFLRTGSFAEESGDADSRRRLAERDPSLEEDP